MHQTAINILKTKNQASRQMPKAQTNNFFL